MSSASIEQLLIPTSSGKLEMLACATDLPHSTSPPILCLHGAYCSANDFRNFLPYFAARGYPAYSLSIRGHGKSWSPSWLSMNLFTTLDDYVADITSALDYISLRHSDASPPILIGHSFGGGQLQYLLGKLGAGTLPSRDIAGLVLLAAAPLSGGGKEIMANWELVEAGPSGYEHFWSPRAQLNSAEQIRAAFFHDKTDETTVKYWLEHCKTSLEGIRIGLSVLWPFATAEEALRGLTGIATSPQRKVLCIAGEQDPLVPTKMVKENASEYMAARTASGQSEASQTVSVTVIPQSGHHLAMDSGWEICAQRITKWIEGKDLQ